MYIYLLYFCCGYKYFSNKYNGQKTGNQLQKSCSQ